MKQLVWVIYRFEKDIFGNETKLLEDVYDDKELAKSHCNQLTLTNSNVSFRIEKNYINIKKEQS